MLPKKLLQKIDQRKAENALRYLGKTSHCIDFYSNDYLGFATNTSIALRSNKILNKYQVLPHGATGSRLLSGNHSLYNKVEKQLCEVHQSKAALIYNSGYTANLGFFGAVPQRGDIILYDEFIHASIRDGIQISKAKSYKFSHNDMEDLGHKLVKYTTKNDHSEADFTKAEVYVVTESVFSMDGDSPNLIELSSHCKEHQAHLIVDEAHAVGIFGYGLVQEANLHQDVFARIITFGKALGCHGAAILGSSDLITYLINFSRSFIYTTALPPHTIANIQAAYEELKASTAPQKLHHNIRSFQQYIKNSSLQAMYVHSSSAIQSIIIPGNNQVKAAAKLLQEEGFEVKPILSPTVPASKERLRFCLHSYNTEEDIAKVLTLLATFVHS